MPPGPRGLALLGSLPEFRRDPLAFYRRCAREYGDICHLRIAGAHVYLISRPEYIESVLVDHARGFMKGRVMQANRIILGNGLFVSEGDEWRQQRRMMSPAFHRDRMAEYAMTMTDAIERVQHSWQTRGAGAFDLQAEMKKLTQRIVAGTLFSVDMAAELDETCAQLGELMELFRQRVGLGLLIPVWLPTPSNLRLRQVVARLDSLIYRIITRHQTDITDSSISTHDLLSALINAADHGSHGMSPRQLRDQVITLFIAGHETTALTLSWAWFLLAQHPEAESQLARELHAVLNGRTPVAADMPALRYTEKVVLETLRLYPPAWCIPRVALEPCEIGGYRIPAGASVTASQWVMHRDPRYFDQPEAFRPERWGEAATRSLPHCAYFPFGAGPRQCIGGNFAMTEAVLTLATIAQIWRIELVPGRKVTPTAGLTLTARDGIWVTATQRRQPHDDYSSSLSTTHSPGRPGNATPL